MRRIALMKSMLLMMAAAALGGSSPSIATLTSAPSFSIADASVGEGGSVKPAITKSAVASSYSKITVTISDGSARAGIDYVKPAPITLTISNKALNALGPTIATIQNGVADGNRTVIATITAVRNARISRAQATITIIDDDPPPPSVTWTKCADEGGTCNIGAGVTASVRYGKGTTWTAPRSFTDSIACSNNTFGDPLPGTVKECDASVAPAPIPTPPPPPPPPTSAWISAPLHDGGFARVKAISDSKWETTGAGAGRPLIVGEIVAVYFNGWGSEANGQTSFAVYTLSDGGAGRAYAADLEGVAPSGNPPLPPPNMGLPADWWVPGLVVANKTCANAFDPAQPGVTRGGVYRASMLIGTHHSLASGETGFSGATWIVFASGDPWMGAREIVTGDCLTGQ
jgi:hypothetical protein